MIDGIDFSKLNMGDLINQVQGMAEKSKESNKDKIFTAKAGGGMVSISINGNSEVIDLQIDDSLLEDKDSLEILLLSAMNDILKQSDEFKKQTALNMINGFSSFGK
jgi:DNA-binding YbaB/EbfC family protein